MTRSFPLLLLLSACAPELEPDATDAPPPLAEGEERTDAGAVRVTLDATSETDWVGYAFDGGGVLGTDVAGHIDVQRYRVRLGDGVQAAVVESPFDDVTEWPDVPFTTDTLPAEEDDDYVFNAWYDYDYATHSLMPADVTFVLDDGADLAVKVEVEGYYDEAGTPGFLTLRWAPLEAL